MEIALPEIDPNSLHAKWLLEFEQPEFNGPIQSYFICGTPRSGSSLLCNLLSRCNAFGMPDEYLHPGSALPYLSRQFGLYRDGRLDEVAYLKRLARVRSTPNGIFGIKTHWTDFEPFYQSLSLAKVFPDANFVVIQRRSILAQAISWTIAEQTQRWHVVELKSGEKFVAGDQRRSRPAQYDSDAIDTHMNEILTQQLCWQKLFALNGITPTTVIYEDLLADPQGVCTGVLQTLGVSVDYPFSLNDVSLAKIGTERNTEWADRFMSERRIWQKETSKA